MTISAGYASSSAGPVHFGLGANASAELVEIRWPSGVVQQMKDVAGDRVVVVKETGAVGGLSGPASSCAAGWVTECYGLISAVTCMGGV